MRAAAAGLDGSGAYETANTLDLLRIGYQYVMDWPMDDQPVWLATRNGPILSVPCPIELNDSQVVIHRKQDASDFCDMIVEQFDEMIEQSAAHPLVMNVSIHTYVFGQPFRLRMIRRALRHCLEHPHAGQVSWARPCDIAAHCLALPPASSRAPRVLHGKSALSPYTRARPNDARSPMPRPLAQARVARCGKVPRHRGGAASSGRVSSIPRSGT
jgi:hypothetical protein